MSEHPLYAIASTDFLHTDLEASVEAALKGGASWVQYRDKSDNKTLRRQQAQLLKALCHDYGAKIIINDDLELALTVAADGLHLGQGDGDPKYARERLGPQAILGVTCHDSMAFARQALAQGASYLAFGRFFPSRTKPDAPAAPLTLLTEAREAFRTTPLVAIGGITLDNGHQVLNAGANRLAVSQNLFGADDIEAQARAYGHLAP